MKRLVALVLGAVMVVGILPTALADNVVTEADYNVIIEQVEAEQYASDPRSEPGDYDLPSRAEVTETYSEQAGFEYGEILKLTRDAGYDSYHVYVVYDYIAYLKTNGYATDEMMVLNLRGLGFEVEHYRNYEDTYMDVWPEPFDRYRPSDAKHEEEVAAKTETEVTPEIAMAPVVEPATTTTTATTHANVYNDVQEGAWYYEAVMTMTDGGLLKGYGNGNFGPNDNITLGELATLLCRISEVTEPMPFDDGDWMSDNKFAFSPYYIAGTGELGNGSFREEGWPSYKRGWHQPTSWAHEAIMGCNHSYVGGGCNVWDPESYAEPVLRGLVIHVAAALAEDGYMPKYNHLEKYPDGTRYEGKYHWALNVTNEDALAAAPSVIADWSAKNGVCHSTTDIHAFIASTGGEACDCDRYTVVNQCWNPTLIAKAYALDIVQGVDDKGTSACHSNITRAEVCQILYNMGITSEGCVR